LILLDTSGLFAVLYPGQPASESARAAIAKEDPPYVLSPFVLCELDYLITSRARRPNLAVALLDEVGAGAYELALFGADDVRAAAQVVRRYNDLQIGLTDASIVVLAERHETNRVLTLDERHFRALRVGRRPFVVLPADA
jgi:predicted nucleic acid-binding protein